MQPSESQYERIGRFLDGQDVELDSDELAVARQIREAEESIGVLLDAPGSRAAADRACRRLRARLGEPGRYRRLVWPAAAAAVVLVAFGWWFARPAPVVQPGPAARPAAAAYVDAPDAPQSEMELATELLDAEFGELADAVQLAVAGELADDEMETLEWELEHFWLGGPERPGSDSAAF